MAKVGGSCHIDSEGFPVHIASFDIFDVDIGDAWRRLPEGGWAPKSQARRILNEFDRSPARLVGTLNPPENFTRAFDNLALAVPDKKDPFGRQAREDFVDFANTKISDGNDRSYALPQEYEDLWSEIAPLTPKAVYEIVYPVRMLGKKPIYSRYYIQRISLVFPDDNAALAAKIILDPIDKS